MDKVLFIDYAFRKKTNSVDFLWELLGKEFEVTNFFLTFDFLPEDSTKLAEIYATEYQYVICLQVDIPIGLLNNLHYQKCVFFLCLMLLQDGENNIG